MSPSFIPPEMLPWIKMFGGALLFILGLSFGYKFIQASFVGRMTYWAGLEAFGWYFAPLTILVTPLFVHTPPKETNLIRTKTAGWIHLIWGPAFFLLSLMMLVAGADFMGQAAGDNSAPGTKVMNLVLTCGRPDVPPAIVYQPPFTYKFPILRKARRTMFKLLTADIYMDKKKTLNQFEREGRDVRGFGGGKLESEEEEEYREQEEERKKALQQQQQAH